MWNDSQSDQFLGNFKVNKKMWGCRKSETHRMLWKGKLVVALENLLAISTKVDIYRAYETEILLQKVCMTITCVYICVCTKRHEKYLTF